MGGRVGHGRYLMLGWVALTVGAVVVTALWASTLLLVTALFGPSPSEGDR